MCNIFIFMKTLASEEKGSGREKRASTHESIIDLCLSLRDKVMVNCQLIQP